LDKSARQVNRNFNQLKEAKAMSSLTTISNVFDIVENQKSSFNDVLSCDEITWAKESQFAVQQLQKNSFLNGIAWKNQDSLRNAIINVASIGISLNPASRHAYLVPRDNMVCLDVSYMGLKHLAESSGSIEWMQAKIVYANDTYLNNGVDKPPTHNQQTFGIKGDAVGAYCTVKLPNGDYLTEEMDIEALLYIKSKSKSTTGTGAAFSPWNTFPEEMMRKTVVKRAAKYWPSAKGGVSRVSQAINIINEHEGIAEEEPIFTEETKAELDKLIANDSAFSLCAFMFGKSEEEQTALFNSFAKGEVSSNKKKLRELTSVGYNAWQEFTVDVRAYIECEDAHSLKSELLDFSIYEKKMLANLLGEPDTTKLKDLLK